MLHRMGAHARIIGRARAILTLTIVLGAALVTACGGSSAPKGPPTVTLSLTAPNDGAIVSVRTIDVVGQVATQGAEVRVNHQRVHVARSGFKRLFSLHQGMNRIHVVATARGYHRASITVAVRFQPAASQAAGNAFFDLVNAACTKLGNGIEHLPRLTSLAVLRQDLASQAELQQRFVAKLHSIHAPRQYATDYAHFTNLVSETVSDSKFAGRQLEAGQVAQVRALLPKINRLADQALNLGDKLGFQSCDSIVFPSGNG
jgi:hypothetical protein